MYIRMMGGEGLTRATKVAILNANYVARRLQEHYPVLYTGRERDRRPRVHHRPAAPPERQRRRGGDIAKRLMDYGFHAPTVSFPVAGTLMIEPTESESLEELDRFCDALIGIREEIREIEIGIADRGRQPAQERAPHGGHGDRRRVDAPVWPRTRAYPAPWTREQKFWPAVGLVESAAGDRNLICACVPIEEYAEV
jgi:glycine dehydrogenase